MRIPLLVLTVTFGVTVLPAAARQQDRDTTFTWRAYSRVARCSISIYDIDQKDRKTLLLLREIASNGGPSVVDDARYLFEKVGRELGLDPTAALWVFHWGSFSFAGAEDSPKELFLRATVRRTKAGRLGQPLWRVTTREELEVLTDRAFR